MGAVTQGSGDEGRAGNEFNHCSGINWVTGGLGRRVSSDRRGSGLVATPAGLWEGRESRGGGWEVAACGMNQVACNEVTEGGWWP